MGTVTTLASGKTSSTIAGSVPYLVDMEVDIATWAAAEGAPLVASDILETIQVPANTVVLTAGIEVLTALVGENADCRFELGVTGGDVDAFVDDYDAGAAGTYAPTAVSVPVMFAAADTIDLVISAATTAPTSGSFRVWAIMCDVDARRRADEVDRDQLA